MPVSASSSRRAAWSCRRPTARRGPTADHAGRYAVAALAPIYSMFCTCSRIWSMTALSSSPARVVSPSLDLEHSVLASRLNSWARKSSRRPAGSCDSSSSARPRDVRREALQFLLGIGARRQQCRFLIEAGFVEGRAGLHEPCHLLLEPSAGWLRATVPVNPRSRAPTRSIAASWPSTMVCKSRSLVGARTHQPSSARPRLASMASARAIASVSFSSGSTSSSTPLMPSRPSARGRTHRHAELQAVDCLEDLLQRGLIQLDLRLALRALDVEVDGQRCRA